MSEKRHRQARKALTIDDYIQALAPASQVLTEEEHAGADPGPPSPLRPYIQLLVGPAGSLLRAEQGQLAGVPCTEAELAENNARSIDLKRARAAALAQVEAFDRAIAYRDSVTAAWIGTVHEVARHRIADRLVTDKGMLPFNAQPLLDQVDAVRAQTGRRRRRNEAYRTEAKSAAAERDRLRLELKAQRGDRLTVDDVQPPPAPKRGSRR